MDQPPVTPPEEPPPLDVAPPPAVPWAPAADAGQAGPSGWVHPDHPDARLRMAPFRSAATRAKVAVVALVLVSIPNALEILHFSRFDSLVDDLTSGVAGEAEATAFDGTSAMLAGLYLPAVILCAIAFLAWLSRVVENVPALGAAKTRRSPREAIGWWFVPFANWVVPYQIVADVHDRLAIGSDVGRARALLLGWWLIWNVGNLGSRVLSIAARRDETIDDFRATLTMQSALDVCLVAAAVLAILVILRIQRREDEWARTPEADRPVDPAVQPA